MPSAPIRNTAPPDLSRDKSDDQPFPSSSPQFLARRLRPQKAEGVSQNGLSGGLEEVTFLRLPGVKSITGLSKTSLYTLIREKSFPAPVRLGARTGAWGRSEVREWAIERVRASR